MKILQVHNRYREVGGEDTVVAAQTALLTGAGHVVEEHFASNPERTLAAAGTLAVSGWNPSSTKRLRGHLAAFGPELVHIHNTWFALSPAVVWEAARTAPVVLTLHNYRLGCIAGTLLRDGALCQDCIGHTPWAGVVHRCYRDGLIPSAAAAASLGLHRLLGTYQKKVRLFLALTEFLGSVMVAAGLPPDRVHVHQNFTTDPGPRSRPASDSSTVVFVGRLSQEKGLGLLLEAWRRAKPDLELVIVGDGPLEDQLRSVPAPNVTWAGRLPTNEVKSLLLQARAMVVPSQWYEGTPITAVEGMAACLPVLATKVGALEETVGTEAEPFFTEFGVVDDWVRAIEALSDGVLVDSVGQAMRRRYETTHTPQVALDRLHGFYQRALQ